MGSFWSRLTFWTYNWKDLTEWTYTGVDYSLPGNGGVGCVDYLSMTHRVVETVVFVVVSMLEIWFALRFMTLPKTTEPPKRDFVSRRVLLMLMCLAFGVEIGFKFASKQLIWVLNPCHILSMIQIFLLTAPCNRVTTAIFRCHMHALNGAPLAMLFPVLNTRLLPCETEVYYVQHLLLYVIPYFLIRQGGGYTVEPLFDLTWPLMSTGILFIYHFTFLQPLAYLTEVNLNNMLCPAISDPFYGPYYRICAAIHQTLMLLIHGKLYTLITHFTVRPVPFWHDDPTSAAVVNNPYVEQRVFFLDDADASVTQQTSIPATENGKRSTTKINADISAACDINGHIKVN
ncbi:transmembrane protein 164-like [Tubulanus polymorphus]|uniref:transmembrane protein 164-like n=1 Tax=Tubulanus polymorphus TaxID=672921 RepID=UPI003DA64769